MVPTNVDFGLILAYMIPGLIILWGVSRISPSVHAVLQAAFSGKHVLPGLLAVALLAFATGMVVSIGRAYSIDKTFHCFDLMWINPNNPQFGRMLKAHPDYNALLNENYLRALEHADMHNRRPYQFYGNTLLSLIISLVCWLLGRPATQAKPSRIKTCLFALPVFTVVVVLLYLASWTSHYRYMEAVNYLNASAVRKSSTHTRPEGHQKFKMIGKTKKDSNKSFHLDGSCARRR